MKKFIVLIFLSFILSGCATYKFQQQGPAPASGYVVSYDGKIISEYTVGREKSLPDLATAQKRFKRRRGNVEYYYKKMGQIENRLKELFWDPPVMLVDLLGGVLRWPFVAVADYKYNHNPAYKAKMDKLDEEKDALEKLRQDSLKAKLQAYILVDLEQEPQGPEKVAPAAIAVAPKSAPEITPAVVKEEALISPAVEVAAVVPQAQEVRPPVVVKPVAQAKPVIKPVLAPPVAVIIAKPLRGLSPLIVKFSGQKSYSQSGKIVAYDWNFGDGDTSNKKSPLNTYWSTTFGTRPFTATLTVKDEAGNSSSTSVTIEVITQ